MTQNPALSEQAQQRLYPSLFNPNWLILRARREIFIKWVARLGGHELRALDVGGRLQPYRPLFDGRVRDYCAVDLLSGPGVTARARAEALPFADETFDVVICTQMLEYAPSPQSVIDEIHRVLRPGGHLFLSAPAVFPRDSDPEYWRFLASGLRLLLKNFSNVEIAAEGSTISGVLRTINVSMATFTPQPLRSILRFTMVPGLNLLAALLEKLVRTSNDQFTANFSVLARK
jgi:SAM-dependent methyltransferase